MSEQIDAVRALGQAFGLFDAQGNLDQGFLSDPLGRLQGVLTNAAQRRALGEFLDEVIPGPSDARAGFHPLLWTGDPATAPPFGNLYLQLDGEGDVADVAIYGEFHTDSSDPFEFRLSLRVPLFRLDHGNFAASLGSGGTIDVTAALDLPATTGDVRLESIEAVVSIDPSDPPAVVPKVVLKGFKLGSAPARDLELDGSDLAATALEVVLALLHDAVQNAPEPLRSHLLPALGMTSSLPLLPVLQLVQDGDTYRRWLLSLLEQGKLGEWFGHVAALCGAAGTTTGEGTAVNPYRATIVDDGINLAFTLCTAGDRLRPGVALRVGDASSVHLAAELCPIGVPLRGGLDVELLPKASVVLSSPDPLLAPVSAPGGQVACQSARAGAGLVGGQLQPLLELTGVTLAGQSHPKIDLTNLDEVADLASAAIEALLVSALGVGPGRALLALIGAVAPTSTASPWSAPDRPRLDFARFLSDPVGAIGAFHREALLRDGWGALLEELGSLVGLTASASGSGTETDPWAFTAAAASPLAVRAVAWKSNDVSLHLGLDLGLAEGGYQVGVTSELVRLHVGTDLQPNVSLLPEFRGRIGLAPVPRATIDTNTAVSANRLSLGIGWTVGSTPNAIGSVEQLALTVDGVTLPPLDLSFPLGGSPLPDQALLRALLRQAVERWGGDLGAWWFALFGAVQGDLDLPPDFPLLADLGHPIASLRSWLGAVFTDVSADGTPFAESWLRHLATGAVGNFPTRVRAPYLAGAGTRDDAWRVPLDDDDGVLELRVWLEPGIPAAALTAALTAGTSSDALASALVRLRAHHAPLRQVFEPIEETRLASGLDALELFFELSDGVVALASQAPAGTTPGALLDTTHDRVPIAGASEIRSELGGAVAVLISAPFNDASVYTDVIAGADSAHFDFRQEGIAPELIDLRDVTSVVPFYTVDLQGSSVESWTLQLGRVLAQLQITRPATSVVLVAHSASGVAAVRAAGAAPSRVSKVITLATPHLGARPLYAAEPASGLALRVARALLPAFAPSLLEQSLRVAGDIVDGRVLGAGPMPLDLMLQLGALEDAAGVPIVAIRSRIGAGFRAALSAAAANVTPATVAPSAVHSALALKLDPSVDSGQLSVRAELELELGSIGLVDGGLDVSAPKLSLLLNLERIDGWLLGGPGAQPDGSSWPARVRRASVRCRYDGSTLATEMELLDAAVTAAPRSLSFDDAETPAVLDALFARLAGEPAANKLMQALSDLGLLVPGQPRIAADALNALRADGASYIFPRLKAALAAPFYGHQPGTGLDLGPAAIVASASGVAVSLSHPLFTGNIQISGSLQLGGELTARAADASLTWRHPAGGSAKLSATLEPWVRELELWPLVGSVPNLAEGLLFSIASDLLLRSIAPVASSLPPLDAVLQGRVPELSGNLSLGASAISRMLRQLSTALGNPSSEGLLLTPPGLLLKASDPGDGRTRLSLSTPSLAEGALSFDISLTFGGGLAVEPGGSITLRVPDPPGTAGDAWRDVALELTLDGSGVGAALAVGTTRITFLPSFSGFQSLLQGGAALLPRALDEIVAQIPNSPVKAAVLDVAAAFDLFGPNFAAHVSEFQNIGNWTYDTTLRTQIVEAMDALFDAAGVPGATSHAGTTLTWTSPTLTAPVTGSVSLSFDWADALPALGVTGSLSIPLATGTGALDSVGLELGLDALLSDDFHALASVGLDRPLGTNVVPKLELGVEQASGGPEAILRLLPLAVNTGPGPVNIELLPTPRAVVDDDELATVLGFDVLLPLLAALYERVAGSSALWPGGPSLVALVDASGLFDSDRRLLDPAPSVATVLGNVAAAMSMEVTLDSLTLRLGSLGDGRIGVAARGVVPIPIDDVELELIFGNDTEPVERTEVVIFAPASGGGFDLQPGVSANHFGIGVKGAQGKPLLDTDVVRLGGASGYTFFDVGLVGDTVEAEFRGVGLALEDLGVSLGAATGGNNAIATGILQSSSNGDAPPPQPGFGLSLQYVQGPESEEGGAGDWKFSMRLLGENERRIWLGIRAGFGPLYIDQIGIEIEKVDDPNWLALLIDGGVSLAGFAAQVDDLAIRIPLRDFDKPANWGVDLAGLGVAYSGGGVSILGGLVRRDIPNGVEYAGMLQLRFQNLGAVAVGAWAKQTDEQGELDSLFIFAGVFVTISFAPYFELRALGAGFGYNRALIVPEDMNAIPDFTLVQVLDNPGAVEQPMALLNSLSLAMPTRRGTFWFAAGIRGALFTVVDVIAVLYVSLDKNFEIGIVGVGRLAQPEGAPIVSIELAVKARFSSAEGVLSIQAQLTDNSWLLVPNCQLTGGFALFIWFKTGKFVLTIGGYHPAFVPEPEFPIVPRLGFRLTLDSVILIKGETYFALTNSAVMAGARLEAIFDIGWLRAWFKAWADFLLSWDPFYYDISIGIELGAEFNIEIDLLFGTVRIHFSISVGASVHLLGPPLHGEVTANLGPISVTMPFGDSSSKPPLLTWEEFRDRYVLSGDAETIPVSVQPDTGLIAPDSKDSPPQGLTPSDPFRLVPEFSFSTSTAMPGSKLRDVFGSTKPIADVDIDFGPMGETVVDTTHHVTIKRATGGAVSLDTDRIVIEQTMGNFAEAIWRYRETPRAGAENIRGLAGITLKGIPEALNPSAPVPILTLVDVGFAHPLPFAKHTNQWRAEVVSVGEAALGFAGQWTTADIERLLSKDSPARSGLVIGKSKNAGSRSRALARRRSPPLVAALSEGMDLQAVGRGSVTLDERPIKPLQRETEPRLLHASMVEVTSLAPLMRTTVTGADTAPRMAPPRMADGTKLTRLISGRPKTRVAAAARSLPGGRGVAAATLRLAKQALSDGIELPAGAVQRWSIPGGNWSISLSGDAFRVIALARGGVPVLDVEASGSHRFQLPARAEQLVVWSLGRAGKKHSPEFGALSLAEAPRLPAAVGWTTESQVHLAGRLLALARGSRVRLSVPQGLPARASAARAEWVRASSFVHQQPTVQTTLPAAVTAVLVAVSVGASGKDAADDLEVGFKGATFDAPLPFEAEWGQGALYPVQANEPFAVTVASQSALRLQGVVGVRGRSKELAAALHGSALSALVPDAPLSAVGSVRLKLKGNAQ